MIVIATSTIMSGLVLRWYRNENCAQHCLEPEVSASRDGVRVYNYLHLVQPEVSADAKWAFQELSRRAGREDEVTARLATHRWKHFGSDEVEPVVAPVPDEVKP